MKYLTSLIFILFILISCDRTAEKIIGRWCITDIKVDLVDNQSESVSNQPDSLKLMNILAISLCKDLKPTEIQIFKDSIKLYRNKEELISSALKINYNSKDNIIFNIDHKIDADFILNENNSSLKIKNATYILKRCNP